MGTSTYIPLANLTLGASAASVTFSSISQAYRDLVLVATYATSTGDRQYFRFNSDTNSNYNSLFMRGNGSVTSSGADASIDKLLPDWGGSTGSNTVSISNIMDYSITDKHKTVLSRGNNATSGFTSAYAHRWASTSAITSILVAPDSGTFTIGSTFSLFGVAA